MRARDTGNNSNAVGGPSRSVRLTPCKSMYCTRNRNSVPLFHNTVGAVQVYGLMPTRGTAAVAQAGSALHSAKCSRAVGIHYRH